MKVIKASNLHVIAAIIAVLTSGNLANNSYICQNTVLPICSEANRICNEALTIQGSNRCSSNNDCISGRTCSPFGWCQGTQDVIVVPCPENAYCKGNVLPACSDNISRICNEGLNSLGSNRCSKSTDCFSGRECSDFGWCQGNASAHEIDCSTLDTNNPGAAVGTSNSVTCTGLTNSLSNGLQVAKVPSDSIADVVKGIQDGTSEEGVLPEDNSITDAFASLNDEDFQKVGKILQDIEISIPENSCPALQTEVRKISVYLANSRKFNIIPPVIPVITGITNETSNQQETTPETQTTTSTEEQVAPTNINAEAQVQETPSAEQTPVVATETEAQNQENQPVQPVVVAETNPVQEEQPAENEAQPENSTSEETPVSQEEVIQPASSQDQPQNQNTVVAGQETESEQTTPTEPSQEQTNVIVEPETSTESQNEPVGVTNAEQTPVQEEQQANVQNEQPTQEGEGQTTEQQVAPIVNEEQQTTTTAPVEEPSQEEQPPIPEKPAATSEEEQQTEETQAPAVSETTEKAPVSQEEQPAATEETPQTQEEQPVATEETPQTQEETIPVVTSIEEPQKEEPSTEENPTEQPVVISEETTTQTTETSNEENEAYKLVLQAMQAPPGQEPPSSLIYATPAVVTETEPEVKAPEEPIAEPEVKAPEEPIAEPQPEPETTETKETPETEVVASQNFVTSTNSKPGLNGAIIKILQINKEFTQNIKASTQSDEKVINLITEDFFKDIFGDPELKVHETPAEYNSQLTSGNKPVLENEVFVVPGPVKETVTIIENPSIESNVTSDNQTIPVIEDDKETSENSELPSETPVNEPVTEEQSVPVAEDSSLITVLENPETSSQEKSENSSNDVSAPALRLLTILKLYKEHVAYRDSNQIVDYRHYGHLRDFQRHLSCLIDQTCDFQDHLKNIHQDYQTQSLHQAKHLEVTAVVQERSALGKFWCKIRGFFRSPCEDLVVLVHPAPSAPAHLQTAGEQRGWWARTWCGIRSFFRRPCPEIIPAAVVVSTTTTTSTVHLMDEEEGSGFFTLMTSRKLANYLNSASKHLIAHKEEDQGDDQTTEKIEETSEQPAVETTDQAPADSKTEDSNSTGLGAKEHVETIDDQSVVVLDTTESVRSEIQELIDQLPNCLSNDDIKKSTHKFIENAHTWLTNTDQSFPNTSKNIEGLLNVLRASAAIGKNITGSQLKAIIEVWQQETQKKIDAEFTKDGISSRINNLEKLKDNLSSLKTNLQVHLPLDSVLQNDLQSIIDKLLGHINVFTSSQDASDEDFVNARTSLKKELVEQVNGVDTQGAAELINDISITEEDILNNSNFGKSLNPENFNFIVHKVVQAFHSDADRLKDNSKASEVVTDVDDLNLLADNVIDELKKSHQANEKAIIDLRDVHDVLQKTNNLLDIKVNTGNTASDSAELLKKYDEAFYKTLASQDFHDKLKEYVNKYFAIFKAHTKPWSKLVAYSQAYKALTVDITNPNAVQTPPQVVVKVEPTPPVPVVVTPSVEEQPVTPIEEEPTAPVEEQPTAPVEEQPVAPVEEQPVAPIEEQPVAPVEEQPVAPIEEQPVAPVEEQPVAPVEEQPTAPVEEQPAAPVEEQPAAPVEEQPVAPVEEQPIAPVEEQPIAPVEEQPAASVEEQPATPVEEPTIDVESPAENPATVPANQQSEDNNVDVEVVQLLHSSVYNQLRHLDNLSPQDRQFFQFFNHLMAEWAHTKDVNSFTKKLDQIIRALQGRQSGLRSLSLIDITPAHKLLDKVTQFKESVTGIVRNLGTTYDSAVKLSDTLNQGQAIAQQAKDFFSLKNPILAGDSNSTGTANTGFFGKIKSWFGKRRLATHSGITDTFESLKNVYRDLETAHNTAEELKKNVEGAKNFANDVKSAFSAIGGLMG